MDNINKTSLEEAKANFQQIKKFATEAAKKEFESEINDKINKILKESLSVEIDDDNNITVSTEEKVVELNNDGEVEVEDKIEHEEEMSGPDGENYEDDEEIEIEKNNIDEMIIFEQDQPQVPEVPSIDAPDANMPPAEAPMEEPAVDNDVLELAQLIDRIIDKKVSGGEPGQGVDVDYIDDETEDSAAPAPVPAAPVPAAPVQEDNELLEFSLDEIDECGMEDEAYEIYDDKGNVASSLPDEITFDDKDDNMLEFDINEDDNYFDLDIEDNPEAMFQAHADISREPNWKEKENGLDSIPFVTEEEELDEIKGQGKILRNTSNRLGLEPREGTPSLQESTKKIKAQYESKIGELTKENKRLNESNKEFSEVIKNYQESFKGLRKQFDEMQSFNAKLAYANKIFASGGLSTSEKVRIAEEFDKTQTVDDAKKLYNKILEENKISISKDNASKIKATTTNTIKGKDTIYESFDMKRRKILAGIEKNEDYL